MLAEEFIKNYGEAQMRKAKTKDEIKRCDFENYARTLTENKKYWDAIQLVYNFHPAIDEVEGKKQIASIIADYGIGIVMAMASQAREVQGRDNERQRLSKEREELRERIAELSETLQHVNDRIEKLKELDLYIKLDWKL